MFRRLAVLLILVLAGCNDPGGVGSGLIDTIDGAPEVVRLEPAALVPEAGADITGGTARFFAGLVEDPDLGSMSASAYVDFSAPASLSDAFRNGTVTRATLLLKSAFVYGYTGTLSEFDLRTVDAEFIGVGSTADSVIQAGSIIAPFEFTVGSGNVEIPMPAPWVTDWNTALRSATFGGSFHGFALEPRVARAVSGFDMTGTVLKVYAGGDSAYFPALTNFTHVEADPLPARTDGRVVFQDGRSAGYRLTFDFDDERLALAGLARGFITIEVDTTFAGTTPDGFVRPLARSLTIDAVSEDPPARLTVASANLIDGVFYLEQSELHTIMQRSIQGDSVLDYFILRAPLAENGLGVLLLGGAKPPTASLTVLKAE